MLEARTGVGVGTTTAFGTSGGFGRRDWDRTRRYWIRGGWGRTRRGTEAGRRALGRGRRGRGGSEFIGVRQRGRHYSAASKREFRYGFGGGVKVLLDDEVKKAKGFIVKGAIKRGRISTEDLDIIRVRGLLDCH